MAGRGSGRERVSEQLAETVRKGLESRMHRAGLMTKLGAVLLRPEGQVTRRLRREALNMANSNDQQRWQMLHNDLERYEIVAEKDSNTARGNHCHIVYVEKGDDLPLIKSGAALRKGDKARIKEVG